MNQSKDSPLKITAADKKTTLGQSHKREANIVNPEYNGNQNTKSCHRNPLFHRQKPFLAQVKQKNINSAKQTNSNVISMNQDRVQDYTRLKTSSFVVERNQKNKSKYDYLIYAQKQIQLQKESSKELPRSSSRELSKELSKQLSKDLSQKDSLPPPYKMTISSDESKSLKDQNKILQNSIIQLQQELNKQIQMNNFKEKEIYQRNQVIQDLMTEIEKNRGTVMDYQKMENAYNQVLMENQRLRGNLEYFQEIDYKYQQLMEHCSQLEQILNQKDRFLEDTINNKEREYNSAMLSKKGQIKSLEHRLEILERENSRLGRQLDIYATERGNQTNINKFQELSIEFQLKMNTLTDENIHLKNTISQAQGTIEQLKMQNNSLSKIITAFEDRDLLITDSKLQSQLKYFKEKLELEQEQNDRLRSQYQLQILKLQNQLAEKRYEQTGSLLDFTDKEKILDSMMTVLAENEKLKRKLAEKV